MDTDTLHTHLLDLERRVMGYAEDDMRALLADDFVEFGSAGGVYTRQDQLAFARSGEGVGIRHVVRDFQVRPLAPGVALATYRTERLGDNRRARRSSIWVQADGGWKMAFHQGTPEDPASTP